MEDKDSKKLNEGVKYDEHKLPVHLLPFDALMAITEILHHGAKKYTNKFENKLEGFWTLVNPVAINLFTPKGTVATVMKNNLDRTTLSLQRNKEKILENGPTSATIENKKTSVIENVSEIDTLIRSYEQEINEPNSLLILKNLELMKKLTKHTSIEDALSAVVPNTYTLITTMKLDCSVVYYVVSTTTVSDSLEITFKELKPHLPILGNETLLEVKGERNWERGMEWHRPFRACLSHLWKWWMKVDDGKGPGMDEETGKSHLLHAGCCVLFLISYELRKIGKDTRP